MSIFDQDLTEDQIMMRDVCRRFVDNTIIPFISKNWKTEWDLTPESRLPNSILEDADKIGIRTLAVPEEYGGMPIDAEHEVRTFAIISEAVSYTHLTLPTKA